MAKLKPKVEPHPIVKAEIIEIEADTTIPDPPIVDEKPKKKKKKKPYNWRFEKWGKDSLEYHDDLFDACKEVLNTNQKARLHGIHYIQPEHGTNLIFYQGHRSNVWGFVDAMFSNEDFYRHKIIIHNSTLRGIFKLDKVTEKFFKEVF